MKHKYNLAAFILYCIFSLSLGEGRGEVFAQSTWQKVIYKNPSPFGTCTRPTNDSGFVILGRNDMLNTIALQKIDKNGKQQWTKSLKTNKKEIEGNAIMPARDGGYIIVGGERAVGGPMLGRILKVNNAGEIDWANKYGEDIKDWTVFNSVDTTNDGGYIVFGSTTKYGLGGLHNEWDMYLAKLDKLGNVLWSKTYGRAALGDFGYCVKQTKDGGYILAGDVEYLDSNPACLNCRGAAILLKTNSLGVMQWVKTYGYESWWDKEPGVYRGNGFFQNVIETADSGFLATGSWVVKTDESGRLKWSTIYYTPTTDEGDGFSIRKEELTDMVQEKDGGYVFPITESLGGSHLTKINNAGSVQWSKYYGRPGSYPFNDFYYSSGFIPAENDGGYVLLGNDKDTIQSIIKTDSLGNSGGCELSTAIRTVTITDSIISPPYVNVSRSGSDVTTWASVLTDYTYKDSSLCITPPVTAVFRADNGCITDSVFFRNTSVAFTYNWDFGDSASGGENASNSFEPKHKYPALGTYNATLTVGDGKGNFSSITHTVTIVSNEFMTISENVSICVGSSVQLTASGACCGTLWSPGTFLNDSTLSDPVATPTITTQYIATSNNSYCYDFDTLTISVLSLNPTISSDISICEGTSTSLSASLGFNYIWNTGSSASSITVTPTVSSTYSLVVSDKVCNDSLFVKVFVSPVTKVEAGTNITINQGLVVELNATSSENVKWFPADGLSCINCFNPTVSPTKTTTYYVTSESAGICALTDSITIVVLNCDEIFIPNAFSPNNDGNNDIVSIHSDCLKEFVFKIFDRWGNKVFETDKITEAWDGKYSPALFSTSSGKMLDPAVFVYYLDGITFSGVIVTQKGNISLIR